MLNTTTEKIEKSSGREKVMSKLIWMNVTVPTAVLDMQKIIPCTSVHTDNCLLQNAYKWVFRVCPCTLGQTDRNPKGNTVSGIKNMSKGMLTVVHLCRLSQEVDEPGSRPNTHLFFNLDDSIQNCLSSPRWVTIFLPRTTWSTWSELTLPGPCMLGR